MASIAEAVERLRRGGLVVVADDPKRENEGDLLVAAELATAAAVSFMVHQGGGLLCVALRAPRLKALGIPPMPSNGGDRQGTAMCVSVDARAGLTTGISATERARTARALAKEARGPQDLVWPGHVTVLRAHPGGILRRAGHTEAAVTLSRWAGLQAAGLIIEILNPDGTMARRGDLEAFAAKHALPFVTIGQLQRAARRRLRLRRGLRLAKEAQQR